jgi:hypothetical protein
MVFSTPCLTRSSAGRLFVAACLLALATFARADTIFVQSVDLGQNHGEYYLSASFNISLTPKVEEALNRGVPLHFVVEFEVIYPRWYTLYFWNKRLAELTQTYRLSYNALTRQYRLSYGVLYETFDTLDDALAFLGNIRDERVFEAERLEPDVIYDAQIRMQLDIAELPKPFQIDALGSDDWDVSSSWFRWTVKR